jgi:hypothetical protein
MADVKLTPRQTARLLTHLDESVRQLMAMREQLIDAMARRTVKRQLPRNERRGSGRTTR